MLKKIHNKPYLNTQEFSNKFHTIQWKGPKLGITIQGNIDTATINTHLFVYDPVLSTAGHKKVR